MRLAIVGSRKFEDYDLFLSKMNELIDIKNITLIVSGGAIGADSMGMYFAKENKIETLIIAPDWENFGRAAGFIRNEDIVKNSDVVIAFLKDGSKGTLNSIKHAQKMNKILHIVECP